MIQKLKQNMSSDNFNEFKKDYDNLMLIKNTDIWRTALKHRLKKPPYLKYIYNMLSDKYDYKRYKSFVYSDTDIYNLLEIDIDNREIATALELFYITDTYIGFIVEELLASELTEANMKVDRDDYLDNYKKSDIKVNGRDYQIKNVTFLNRKDIEEAIENYYHYNHNLFFIFYDTKADDIYITTINKYPFTHISDINDIVNFRKVEDLSLEEYIQQTTNKN